MTTLKCEKMKTVQVVDKKGLRTVNTFVFGKKNEGVRIVYEGDNSFEVGTEYVITIFPAERVK